MMNTDVVGEKVDMRREAAVRKDPITYVIRKPYLLATMAAIGIVISIKPLNKDPTKDIMPVPSSKWLFKEGRMIPNDNVMAPLIKLPTKQAILTSQPHPPSGGA